MNALTAAAAGPNLQLKAEIVRRGLTQKSVALALGMGEVELSYIIRGRKRATPEIRARIARELDADESDIFPEPDAVLA